MNTNVYKRRKKNNSNKITCKESSFFMKCFIWCESLLIHHLQTWYFFHHSHFSFNLDFCLYIPNARAPMFVFLVLIFLFIFVKTLIAVIYNMEYVIFGHGYSYFWYRIWLGSAMVGDDGGEGSSNTYIITLFQSFSQGKQHKIKVK